MKKLINIATMKSLRARLNRRWPLQYHALRELYYQYFCAVFAPYHPTRIMRIVTRKDANRRSDITVAIHTTFIAKENILFLREWIEYYRLLGVSEFHLYDNSSLQYNIMIEPGKTNIRGIPYDALISLTDDEVKTILMDIQKEVPGVYYTRWEPKDESGRIVYGQIRALNQCNRELSGRIDWLLNCDTDEFLVVPDNIPSLCRWLEEHQYDAALIGIVKMVDRWQFPDRNILDIGLRPERGKKFWAGKKYLHRPEKVSNLAVHDIGQVETKYWLPKKKGLILHYNSIPGRKDTGELIKSDTDPPQHICDQVRANTGKYGSLEWRQSILNLQMLGSSGN